jgi:hypothetical protein
MDYFDLVRNARMGVDTGNYGGARKKISVGAVLCTLCLCINQAQSSQTEVEAAAALCDAIRYQAYNTMELRQFSTPKYKLKEMVDRNITNVNSRMTQYKLIDEAYMVELAKTERGDLVAHEFAEGQRAKCMREQNM